MISDLLFHAILRGFTKYGRICQSYYFSNTCDGSILFCGRSTQMCHSSFQIQNLPLRNYYKEFDKDTSKLSKIMCIFIYASFSHRTDSYIFNSKYLTKYDLII